jgi:hypothetical protein
MPITCACPKCNAHCEYDEETAGLAIECNNCGRIFLSPSGQDKKAPSKPEAPIPGFYRAVFIGAWKLFARPHNYILIGLIITITIFKFFLAGGLCADRARTSVLSYMYIAGVLLKILLWGWFAGIYFNIICDTAYGEDNLSDDVEDAITAIVTAFASSIGRPILLFYYALIGSQIPLIVAVAVFQIAGFKLNILLHFLFLTGLFLFPVALLTVAVTEDILSMRPDYFFKPILKAFRPYLVVFAFTIAAAIGWLLIGDMDAVVGTSQLRIALELLLNIGFQFFAIMTMRTIGLYYRHYSCYFPW